MQMDARQRLEIERLYFELFEQLRIYALSALENDALAEETVQETFRIACMKPRQLLSSPNPRGWLINTLKYVIQNTQKIRNRANNLIAECMAHQSLSQNWSENAIDPDLLYEDISNSVEYQMVKAFALEGRSLLELAQEQGISLDTCKKRLQRARKTLKQKINEI